MRMRRSLVMLAVLAAGLVFEFETAVAQVDGIEAGAYGGGARQLTEQEEAERAERRKSYEPVVYPKFMEGGERPDIQPATPPIVYFDQPEGAGSIIVDTQNRKLYFILPGKKAYAYPISVGRDGFTWSGTEKISRIAEWPSWTPPPEMRQRIPGLPVTVSGGLKNPQGARALYLGNTVYRIHGTNNDRTVGRANSSGCFRLANEHVVHLASIAKVGTTVKVLPTYNGGVSENAPLSSLFGFLSPEPEPAAKTKPKKSAQSKKPAATPAAQKPAVAATDTNAAPSLAPAPVPSGAAAAPTAASADAPAKSDALAAARAAAQEARSAANEAAAAAQAAKSAAAAMKQATP
jgi:lipoprotein-anchoring transpeptidase ErfK/SrfK